VPNIWERHRSKIVFAVTLIMGLAVGWVALPAAMYEKISQPLAFDHDKHTGAAGLACKDCHDLTSPSGVGLPPLAKCEECHAQAVGDSAAEKVLVEQYIQVKREIPWLVYARQPDNVWFPHAPHLGAGVACERCHGPHGASKSLRPFERNRLTGYSRDIWGPKAARFGREAWQGMKMTDCVACHRQHQVEDACLDCHK
jgi:hypothetical protein